MDFKLLTNFFDVKELFCCCDALVYRRLICQSDIGAESPESVGLSMAWRSWNCWMCSCLKKKEWQTTNYLKIFVCYLQMTQCPHKLKWINLNFSRLTSLRKTGKLSSKSCVSTPFPFRSFRIFKCCNFVWPRRPNFLHFVTNCASTSHFLVEMTRQWRPICSFIVNPIVGRGIWLSGNDAQGLILLFSITNQLLSCTELFATLLLIWHSNLLDTFQRFHLKWKRLRKFCPIHHVLHANEGKAGFELRLIWIYHWTLKCECKVTLSETWKKNR